jgi:hypothetical protein
MRCLPTIALLLLAATPAAAQFEGTVTFQSTDAAGKASDTRFDVKGDLARVDMAGAGYMIVDGKSGRMLSVMDERKMYTVVDMAAMAKGPLEEEMKTATVTAVGKTETIAGRSCELWRAENPAKGTVTEMCLARGMGNFGLGEAGKLAFGSKQWQQALKGGAFPLRTVVSTNGKPTMTMVATKVEARKFDAAHFQPPAGYQQLDMGAMMGGMAPPAAAPKK